MTVGQFSVKLSTKIQEIYVIHIHTFDISCPPRWKKWSWMKLEECNLPLQLSSGSSRGHVPDSTFCYVKLDACRSNWWRQSAKKNLTFSCGNTVSNVDSSSQPISTEHRGCAAGGPVGSASSDILPLNLQFVGGVMKNVQKKNCYCYQICILR